jgi:hypothetical protein
VSNLDVCAAQCRGRDDGFAGSRGAHIRKLVRNSVGLSRRLHNPFVDGGFVIAPNSFREIARFRPRRDCRLVGTRFAIHGDAKVSSSVRRAIGDVLMFASGVMILVFALVATDGRVRERASMLVGGGPPLAGVADVATRAGDVATIAVHVARSWTREHEYLTIFAAAALVLVTAVLRLCSWP